MEEMNLTPINILIDEHAFALHYVHNNFGDNVLFLLRNRNYYPEDDLNRTLMDMIRINEGESRIVLRYAKAHNDAPFIVPGKDIADCIQKMNFILAGIVPYNLNKLWEEEIRLRKFSMVCHDIHDREYNVEQVLMCGWEFYFDQNIRGEGDPA